MYASATQDCSNKVAVAKEMCGFPFSQPYPDLDEIELLVIVGANPGVSKWSFLQVANLSKRIAELRARGAKVVVIDPRRTETAKVASERLFIRAEQRRVFLRGILVTITPAAGAPAKDDWSGVAA